MPLDLAKIKRLRDQKGLSLADAAKAAGFTSRQIWFQIESGARPNPSIDTVQKMAKALCVKVDDLLK